MNGCYLSLFPQSSKARRYQPTPRSPSWWKRRQTRARHLARLDRIHPRQQRNCRLQQNLVRWTLDPTRTRRQFPLPDSARLRRPQNKPTGHHRPAEAQQNRRERHRKGFATKRTAPFGTFSFRLMHFHFLHQFYPFTSRITLFNSWFPTVLFARNEHRN